MPSNGCSLAGQADRRARPSPPEIGAALVSFGVLFLFLGIILFFDAALLALGNVLFTSGITLLIGPQKTFYFFARKQKLRGTVCFFVGMLLVFAKWTIIGMIVEAIGFLNLFGWVRMRESSFMTNLLTLSSSLSRGLQRLLPRHSQLPPPAAVCGKLSQPARHPRREYGPTCYHTPPPNQFSHSPHAQVLDKLAGARQSAV